MEAFNPLNTFVYHVFLSYFINRYLIKRKYIDSAAITAGADGSRHHLMDLKIFLLGASDSPNFI
jgi:hypothetical protein